MAGRMSGSAQHPKGFEGSLEARLADLQARTEALEAWVAAQAPAAHPTLLELAQAALPPEAAARATPSPGTLLGHLGRACLILGGAFLLRTTTDSGWVPPGAGVALGLAYAWAWALAGAGSARRGHRLWGAFQVFTGALVAYPLLWETTVRFHFLPPAGAAAALLASALLCTGAALAHDLRRVAWLALLGALGLGFALMAATSAITSFCLAILALEAASLALDDLEPWRALRWPTALAADGAVLLMVFLALSPGSSTALAQDLRPVKVMLLALALVAMTLGRFLQQILRRPRAMGGFQIFQALAVLAIGLGGGIRVAQASGTGAGPLGLAAALAGLGCYGCAFAFIRREAEGSLDFYFLTSLAALLLLSGSLILLPASAFALACVAAGLGTAWLGARHGRFSLHLHGALFLGVAALASGLAGATLQTFLRPGQPTPAAFAAPALVALAGLAAGHLLAPARTGSPWPFRLPSFALAGMALVGTAALAAAGAARLLPGDPGALAAARTGILGCLGAGAALAGRRWPGSESGWLPYPVLAGAALKFLLEDLPHGRPLTLFLGLTGLGLAFLAIPSILKRPGPARDGA